MAPHIPENMVVLIPKTIFAEPLQAALRKATRPPTRRTHSGDGDGDNPLLDVAHGCAWPWGTPRRSALV